MAAPKITNNRLTLLEGQTVELSTSNFNASVENVASENIVFTIVPEAESSLSGDFLLTPVGTTQAQAVQAFTLADVEQGRVRFRHDLSNAAPRYSVTATALQDGVEESSEPAVAEVFFTATNDAPKLDLNVLSIAEGGTVVLNSNLDAPNLNATDEPGESTAETLTYTVVLPPGQDVAVSNGQLQRVEGDTVTVLEAGDTFTQADVDAGRIRFVHDGSEAPPRYTLTLTDDGVSGTGLPFEPITTNARTVTVQEFTPFNDAPVITTNSIRLVEGGIVSIGTNNLAAEDAEDPDETLTFTITSITGGRFELVEDGVVTVLASPTTESIPFTQDHIFQGRVRFVNDPATDEEPTYIVEVIDDGTPGPAKTDSQAATVDFTAVNDIPLLDTLALTVEEGEQVSLTATNLLVQDEESDAANLTYQVTEVTAGQFIRLSDGLSTISFTQADIDAGNVIAFEHDGSTASPSFSLTVTDEGGESIVIDSGNSLVFAPFNDPPEVVRAQLKVTENEVVRLTSANNLLATDEESSSGQLRYTVTIETTDETQPDSFIVAGEVQTGPTVTFTQAQVGAGQVQFVQGGSNVAPNLSVTVTDAEIAEDGTITADANTIPVDFVVDFAATNDEPRFLANTLAIAEGGTVVLNSADINLQSIDEETPAAALTYTINRVSNGEFQRIDTTEITTLAIGDTFTQADVEQGFIQFVHDGSEVAPDYQLTVNDTGINEDATTELSVVRTLTIPDNGFTTINDTPVIENNTLELTEGDTVFLTLDNLSAVDQEDEAVNLVFTITEVTNGRFERVTLVDGVEVVDLLASPELETPISFTQVDIEQRLIRFVNDPATNDTPTYTVQVSDLDADDPKTASAPGNVQFTSVNDKPQLQTLAMAIAEADVLPLTAAELAVTDEETPPEAVIYSVDTVIGASFVFAADGAPADTFTQADINAGNVVEFRHDGLNDAPTFSLTVTDGDHEITVTEALKDGVTFTSTNDAPMVEVSAFTVNEGETVVLSSDDLKTGDEESTSSDLVYTVAITNNDLDQPDGFRIGDDLFTGPEVTFTQAQVNAGQVAFVHGGANAAPNLVMTVTDGAIAAGDTPNNVPVPLEVNFIASNDEPNFRVNTLAIAEGGTVVLNAAEITHLASTDEESPAAELTYTINSVSNGEFQRADTPEPTPLSVGATFTQADVDAGRIQFVHNGSELAPDYTLTVSDTGINNDPETVLSVQRELTIPEDGFTNTNDAPEFINNTLTLAEGETVFLTLDSLSAIDAEDDDANLIFTITEVTQGRFERVTDVNGGETIEILASPDLDTPIPFTQGQVEQRQIRFVNDPATDEKPTYAIQVSDLDGDAPQTVSAMGDVQFTQVNDAPQLRSLSLTLTESDTVPLTASVLSVVDEETQPGDIRYTVDTVTGGKFVFVADGLPADSFTQADIDAGDVIAFQHDATNQAPTFSLTATDGVNETVITDALDKGVTFIPTNDAPIVSVKSFSVSEGGSVLLNGTDNLLTTDEESLPEDLTYTVTVTNADPDLPDGFQIGEEFFTGTVTFTQAQVNAGLVTFVHGGSNFAPDLNAQITDTFPSELGEPITADVELEVGFTAGNDLPVVVNNALIIREGETLTLTPDNLRTTDEETLPENLTYTVDTVVNGEFRRFAPGLETATLIAVGDTFTQAEINTGTIQFVHNSGEEAPGYSLTVTDTPLLPDAPTNRVAFDAVIPEGGFTNTNDAPTFKANTLSISEGGTVVFTAETLAATDPDSAPSRLSFAITEVEGGTFFLEGAELVEGEPFNTTAIAFEELSFVDDGDDVPPSYTVTVQDLQNGVTTAAATVIFDPLNDAPTITTNTFTFTEGQRLTLNDPGTDVINLAAIDSESGDAITYTVSEVVGGNFFDFNASPISTFSQAELNQGDINFVHDGTETVPSFTLIIRDPEGAETSAPANVIELIPVNDPPTLERAELTVIEGETVTLTPQNFLATDVDSPAETLTFLIRNLEGGQVICINGDAETPIAPSEPVEEETGTDEGLTSFTLAQLAAGEIGFADDGDQVKPAFEISVSDGAFETESVPVIISDFINTNDAPTANADSGEGFRTDERSPITMPSILDNDTDPDPDDVISISQVNGEAITTGSVEIASGAAVSLSTNGALEYDPNGQFIGLSEGEIATDTFEYTIRDVVGATATATVTVEIIGINDGPALETNRLVISQGETRVLTANNVLATDPDTNPEDVSLTVSNVTGGQFILNGEETTRFTQQNIFNGDVSFVHDGSQVAPTYNLTVSDGLVSLEPSTVTVERFIPVDVGAINGGMFDYAQFLRLQNVDAVIPVDTVNGLSIAQFFDEQYYLATNPDVAAGVAAGNQASGYAHFVQFGQFEGRNPSILYNEDYYLNTSTDVAEDVVNGTLNNGLQHFLNNGVNELRSSSPHFNQAIYLDENGDVLESVRQGTLNSGFVHYIEFGANELRDPQLFLYNEAYYLQTNPDVAAAVSSNQWSDGFSHFVSFGQTEGRPPSLLFDEASYLALNPDVAAAVETGTNISGFSHYVQYGRFEGRDVFI